MMPMTGPGVSDYGAPQSSSIKYVFDQVNAQGGVDIAGTKYKLDFKIYDDQATAAPAISAATQLVNDGYQFVLGPANSGSASAVQPIMAKSDAYWQLSPAIVPGPTQLPNVFRTTPLFTHVLSSTLAWFKEHPEFKRVAMATDQLHTGLVASTDDLIAGLKKLGVTTVAQEKFQAGNTDFRALISSVLAKKPDIFLQRANPAEAALMLKQTRELGSAIPVMWNAGLTGKAALALVGSNDYMKDVYQVVYSTNLDPFLQERNKLAETLSKALGPDKTGTTSASAYDMATIFIEGLRRASAPTPKALITAMDKLKASDLNGKTIGNFEPWPNTGLVFNAREVNVADFATVWDSASQTFVRAK